MNWDEIVEKVTPYVVRIETPEGHGTGFACFVNDTKAFWAIATAYHVVGHADRWQQPLRIITANKEVAFFKEDERVIIGTEEKDSAVILVPTAKFKFPEPLIPLLPSEANLPIGVEVGWLGFPGVASNSLCFFSGSVSAKKADSAYWIDGVAINGVSGGPVVHSTPAHGVQIVGVISAYVSNRIRGDALPGLCIAQDVSHFHVFTSTIKSLEEAKKQSPPAK